MFVQGSYEEFGNDFFDQFISYSADEDDNLVYPASSDTNYEEIFEDSHSGEQSLSCTDDEAKHHDFWRPNAWTNDSQASLALPRPFFYNELSGRAAYSDSELLSFGNINLEPLPTPVPVQRPLTSSPTPVAPKKKHRIIESFSKTLKKASASIDKRLRSPIRKASVAPVMKLSNKSTLDLSRLEDFDFSIPSDLALSSPTPDAKELGPFQIAATITPVKVGQTNDFSYGTPLATPQLEAPSSRHVSGQSAVSVGHFPTTPQAQTGSAGKWSQLPKMNDSTSDLTDLNAILEPLPELDVPVWYGSTNNATKIAQPSPTGFHTNPQLATKSLAMQLQNGLAYANNELTLNPMAGLGIQMPPFAPPVGSPIVLQQHPQSYFASPNSRQPLRHRQSQPQFYTQAMPQMRHSRNVSMGIPMGGAASATRPRHQYSNSAYLSPPMTQQPISSQHLNASYGVCRKPQPRRSVSSSPSPVQGSFAIRKRKSGTLQNTSASKPRIPSSIGPGREMDVSFVNYTPGDSKKILGGVAPSGSSKTKARREKEALEKRKKLSQAAVRAVKAAGGSLEALEGFIV